MSRTEPFMSDLRPGGASAVLPRSFNGGADA